jgi:hypothetical protein
VARAFKSDKVLGNMDRHAESGDRECERQGRMQEIADQFVEFEECHWDFPFLPDAIRSGAKRCGR